LGIFSWKKGSLLVLKVLQNSPRTKLLIFLAASGLPERFPSEGEIKKPSFLPPFFTSGNFFHKGPFSFQKKSFGRSLTERVFLSIS